ncbi:hypothetical protein D3C84_610730 [compost metagenome]
MPLLPGLQCADGVRIGVGAVEQYDTISETRSSELLEQPGLGTNRLGKNYGLALATQALCKIESAIQGGEQCIAFGIARNAFCQA